MARPLRIGVAVPAGPLGHGEFGQDAGLQLDPVIARLGSFVRITLAIAFIGVGERPRYQLQLAPRRHDQHVEHVADAGARQMGVAEPHDRAVAMMIARAGIPALDIGIGAELNHAEGQDRARIGMTIAAGADEQIGTRDRHRHGGRDAPDRETGERGPGEKRAAGQNHANVSRKTCGRVAATWTINSPNRPLAQANQSRVNLVGSSISTPS